jgi:hypothetical protein
MSSWAGPGLPRCRGPANFVFVLEMTCFHSEISVGVLLLCCAEPEQSHAVGWNLLVFPKRFAQIYRERFIFIQARQSPFDCKHIHREREREMSWLRLRFRLLLVWNGDPVGTGLHVLPQQIRQRRHQLPNLPCIRSPPLIIVHIYDSIQFHPSTTPTYRLRWVCRPTRRRAARGGRCRRTPSRRCAWRPRL